MASSVPVLMSDTDLIWETKATFPLPAYLIQIRFILQYLGSGNGAALRYQP